MASASSSVSIPSTHRAVVSIGGDKDPVIQQMPVPSFDPSGDLILVRVKASSINPVDFKEWVYNFMNQSLPFTLGWDFSGVIVAVGSKATGGWKVGDEVFSPVNLGFHGSHGDYCLVDGLRLARKPSNLTHLQAASLPIAFTTAYDAIANLAQLSANKTILIMGASGGVGHFAVQLSKVLYGATVIGLASRPEGIELLKSLSVDHIIDYKNDDVQKKVFEITGGKGVDVAFDATAGPAYSLTASLIKEGGKFIGVDAVPPAKETPFWKVLEERKVTDASFADIVKVGAIPGFEHLRVKMFSSALTLAADLIVSGRIKVHIDRVISLNEVPKEIVENKNGKSFLGKVAVQHE